MKKNKKNKSKYLGEIVIDVNRAISMTFRNLKAHIATLSNVNNILPKLIEEAATERYPIRIVATCRIEDYLKLMHSKSGPFPYIKIVIAKDDTSVEILFDD